MVSPVTRLVPVAQDRAAQTTAAGRIRQFVAIGSGIGDIAGQRLVSGSVPGSTASLTVPASATLTGIGSGSVTIVAGDTPVANIAARLQTALANGIKVSLVGAGSARRFAITVPNGVAIGELNGNLAQLLGFDGVRPENYKPTFPLSDTAISQYIDGSKVIPGYDAGPAPEGSFATVVNINAAISRTIQQPNRIWAEVHDRVSVQWFREDALKRALTFTAWVFSPEASELAIGLGLVVLGTTPLRDLSDLISEQWEERANVDVGFGYTIDVVDAQGNPAGIPTAYFSTDGFAPSERAFVSDLDSQPVFRITHDPP